MTPDQLRAVGTALYGGQWQTPLARALGIAPRYLRLWVQGRYAIPAHRAAQIHGLCGARIAAIESAQAAVYAEARNEKAPETKPRAAERAEAVARYLQGNSAASVGAQFAVHAATVLRWARETRRAQQPQRR